MKIVSERFRFLPTRTNASLSVDGAFHCYVLEDQVRADPNPATPENEAKVHGETAVPEGTYPVTMENSPKFGPDTITLHGVPGFKYIRAHSGNEEADTEGCQITGYKLTSDGKILGGTSKPALVALKALIKPALARGEKVTWQIRAAA